MKKLYVPLIFMTLALSPLHAQTHAYLDVNEIRARIEPGGYTFLAPGHKGYVWKAGDISTIVIASNWISAIRANDSVLHASMAYSVNADFMPGPMRLDRIANDAAFSAAWNQVFSVTKQEIELFRQQFALGNVQNGTFPVPASIAGWPGNGPTGYATQLAPYVDINGDYTYNPLHGDYPKIKGDQAVWKVSNDISSPSRTFSDAAPLGIELQQMFYAVMDSGATGNDSVINYSTFVEYNIINRSLNNYVNFDIGLLGDYYNFPQLNYNRFQGTCVYNNAVYTFGDPLHGSTEDQKITQSMMLVSAGDFVHTKSYKNGNNALDGEPQNYHELYNILNGKWRNGTDMVYQGLGQVDTNYCVPGLPAKYYMPAGSDPTHTGTGGIDPGFNWQFNKSGCLAPLVPAIAMRTYAVLGDKMLNAGDKLTFDIAYITQFNEVSNDSAGVEELLHTICQKMDPVKDYYNNVIVPAWETFSTQVFSKPALFKIYPNPSCTEIFLETDIEKPFGVQILNISGQTLRSISGHSNKTAIDISALAPGFYILKAGDGSQSQSIKFIKTRE